MQQPAALRMVHLLGRGECQQPLARLIQQRAHDRAQVRIGDGLSRRAHLAQHGLRRFRRAGHQQRHVGHLLRLRDLDALHAQLHAAHELVAYAANGHDAALRRRRDGAVPHLGVDRARAVAERHVQIELAIGCRALLGRAHEQISLEALVLAKLGDGVCHKGCLRSADAGFAFMIRDFAPLCNHRQEFFAKTQFLSLQAPIRVL